MGEHIEKLTGKVGLARVRVGRYLRKGESGKVEDVSAYVRKGLSVPEAHQLKIAKDTLKMPGPMAGVMGGPSPEQAKKTVERLEAKTKKVPEGYRPKSPADKKATETLQRAAANAFKPGGGSTSAREAAGAAYRIDNPSPFVDRPKAEQAAHYKAAVREYQKMLDAYDAKEAAAKGDTTAMQKVYADRAKALKKHQDVLRKYEKVFTHEGGDKITSEIEKPAKPGGPQPSRYKPKAPKRLTSEELAAKKKAGTTTKVRGYAGPKRSAKETKAILEKQRQGEYLGDDGAGTGIRVGAVASITAGPEKGRSGTVVGNAKGGSIVVRLGVGIGAREVLVDPDELRAKRLSETPAPYGSLPGEGKSKKKR